MADLVITLKGDASDFKKQFDDAVKKLNDFGKSTSQATGYIGGMESQMKLLKTQMRSASESDIPAMRTQFLQLRTAIREAQYGTESFTKKIGGEFDSALSKASKKLFDLGNILKASVGFLGVAGIAGSFVQATGAAQAMDAAIQDLVSGLRLLNRTGVEINLSGTADVIDSAQKYLDSQLPANLQLITKINEQIAMLHNTKQTVDPTSAVAANLSSVLGFPMPAQTRAITDDEQKKINARIALLQSYLTEIIKIDSATRSATRSTEDFLTVGDQLEPRIGFEPFGATSGREAPTGVIVDDVTAARTARNVAANKRWLDDYFKTQEEAINYQEKLQEDAERKRVQIADRYSAGVANVFENAVSAGMRGGFADFITNYMQQVGVRLFGGLIQLALSSATGGSFGIGSLIPKIFGFAGGGEFYTNGAMPIIVGDNPGGIEKVTVTPISGRGTTGLKNGNIALAGGGSVTSMPMGDGMPEIIFRPIIKFDGYDIAYSLEMPNGGYEKLNRARGN